MSSQIVLGILFACLLSAAALYARALTWDGALAAIVVGTAVYAGGGPAWSMPILIFFGSSSLLSRVSTTAVGTRHASRTARQVLANGSLPALWATADMLWQHDLWALLFVATIAEATADTWATEIGRISTRTPRSIISGRLVPLGTSGGVTAVGFGAAAVAATSIAISAVATGIVSVRDTSAIVIAGWLAALIDSLLGATLQERRWCSTCAVQTENAVHDTCHRPTRYLRGVAGFDNDAVNFAAGAAACLIAILVYTLT